MKPLFHNNFQLLFLFTGLLTMVVVMAKTGAPLKTPSTPHGIIDFEFAYNQQQAKRVIGAWTIKKPGVADNVHAAKINIWLDFIFIFFYASFLYHLCRLLSITTGGAVSNPGGWFANAALAAAFMDILENAGMLMSLAGNISRRYPLATFICSVVKWMLIVIVVTYILVVGLLFFLQEGE